MPRYIAFLRAINVGGTKLIKMEELKQMFVSAKLNNVVTYIASGNVLFDSNEADEEKLKTKIEKHLQKSLGYEVDIFIRSIADIEAIMKSDPFKKRKPTDDARMYISFLSGMPTKEQQKQFAALSNEVDAFFIKNRELYTLSYKSKGESILSDALIKKQLKLKATTRNWNTVQKVVSL
jgi:uncharacterized protein (DUF1697 family)